jgi:hypothetical protein
MDTVQLHVLILLTPPIVVGLLGLEEGRRPDGSDVTMKALDQKPVGDMLEGHKWGAARLRPLGLQKDDWEGECTSVVMALMVVETCFGWCKLKALFRGCEACRP